MKPGAVAVVGAAETDRIGVVPDMSRIGLAVESSVKAVQDAGLTMADIDGVASTGMAMELVSALGLRPRWIDETQVGGCSYFMHLRHAAAAIVSGMASAVLVAHGESGRSHIGEVPPVFDAAGSSIGQFEIPYGVSTFASMFTITALRFMTDRGITEEQLAEVAVAQRRWAQRTPRAFLRDPITVEDVLASTMIAYPFHKLECCLVTDGGGALVVTSAERAQDLPSTPVYVLGTGEAVEMSSVSQMADFSSSRAFRDSGAAAFAEAGVTPRDIDHLMIYDAFAHVPLYGLEDLGFVGRGESGAFVADGHTSPGGRLPMNTNGGGLAYTHTGMYGMFALQESIRQVRGEAAAQVPGVELSFAQGVGGMFLAAGSFVFGRSRP